MWDNILNNFPEIHKTSILVFAIAWCFIIMIKAESVPNPLKAIVMFLLLVSALLSIGLTFYLIWV